MFLVGLRNGSRIAPRRTTVSRPKTVRQALARLPRHGARGNDTLCTARVVPAKVPVMRPSAFQGALLFNGSGRPLDLDRPARTLPASMGGNATPIIDQLEFDHAADPWVVEYHRHLSRRRPPVRSGTSTVATAHGRGGSGPAVLPANLPLPRSDRRAVPADRKCRPPSPITGGCPCGSSGYRRRNGRMTSEQSHAVGPLLDRIDPSRHDVDEVVRRLNEYQSFAPDEQDEYYEDGGAMGYAGVDAHPLTNLCGEAHNAFFVLRDLDGSLRFVFETSPRDARWELVRSIAEISRRRTRSRTFSRSYRSATSASH